MFKHCSILEVKFMYIISITSSDLVWGGHIAFRILSGFIIWKYVSLRISAYTFAVETSWLDFIEVSQTKAIISHLASVYNKDYNKINDMKAFSRVSSHFSKE